MSRAFLNAGVLFACIILLATYPPRGVCVHPVVRCFGPDAMHFPTNLKLGEHLRETQWWGGLDVSLVLLAH